MSNHTASWEVFACRQPLALSREHPPSWVRVRDGVRAVGGVITHQHTNQPSERGGERRQCVHCLLVVVFVFKLL